MKQELAKFFDVPPEGYSSIELMLTEEEITLIEYMQDKKYTYEELLVLIQPRFDLDPKEFISQAYKRGVINKERRNDSIVYKSASLYTRLAYFAQYESDLWKSIAPKEREDLDRWYVKKYAEGAIPRLKEIENGSTNLIENAFFYTLDETLNLIDELKEEMYIVPCNCKSVALNCDKPKNVCILFEKDINSEWDRGWGEPISKEKAKEIVTMANKKGLMHTSESEKAICNCDGCCCYPIRASKMIGTQGIWPKKRYNILWEQDRCISCGICAKVCNFNAFNKEGAMISFEKEKCWGCTICKEHCPVSAITLIKLDK
ncbi:4Fe-4S dicluster-binding protein [Alkaliphilus hydrothermalis]|uniref:Pyruvate/2-oxoacid:ferredoxin oxidoreductase delta subunit n=1 Tax=Alkaliphilus hydrothermalis TaxID=1482730 RepID=A0ABS2NT73_9FIRM|nr:4Fe-4S dicluster-binding protein [Alkaliphilus hydrothermalis]MBM7616150.1 Pyruvate/2-oxoacid:ferredoxin oxidoreductase delta subunit [Alkaliphilus hydrothermalis]